MIIAEPKYHLNIINKFKELNINKYDLEFVNDNSQFSVIGWINLILVMQYDSSIFAKKIY